MRAKVILNPHADQGGAKERVASVKSALASAGIEFDLVSLRREGQAKQEALVAAMGHYDVVVAAGGDGTVHEVINGLIVASAEGRTCPLGILPLGTGNDFSDMAGLPRDLELASQVIAAGHIRQVDAGSVRFTVANGLHQGPTVWQGRFFDNNCALAMEPVVTMEAKKATYLSGNLRYAVAVVRTLLKMQAWQMQIIWDNGAYEGPIYLLSVANTPRTGGLFMVAPNAQIDDGLFDFVFAPKMPMTQVLTILPRLVTGTHIRHPKIVTGRTAQLFVRSRPGTPIHADGEIVAESATVANYRILPGKITLLAPTEDHLAN